MTIDWVQGLHRKLNISLIKKSALFFCQNKNLTSSEFITSCSSNMIHNPPKRIRSSWWAALSAVSRFNDVTVMIFTYQSQSEYSTPLQSPTDVDMQSFRASEFVFSHALNEQLDESFLVKGWRWIRSTALTVCKCFNYKAQTHRPYLWCWSNICFLSDPFNSLSPG